MILQLVPSGFCKQWYPSEPSVIQSHAQFDVVYYVYCYIIGKALLLYTSPYRVISWYVDVY